jgi:peptide deformylase
VTISEILLYPENKNELRRKSRPVKLIDARARKVVRDLKDTLQAHGDGIGLAAPQINIHQRVVIVCFGTESKDGWEAGPPRALINPRIILEEDPQKDFDGCLSFPGLYGETVHPHRVEIIGLNENGQPFDEIIEGFNAVIVHHEIDHLDGVLFIDRIENPNDLYSVEIDENGEPIRVSLSQIMD